MNVAMTLKKKPSNMLRMHPKKFAMWLFMVSVVMLFVAFTSAYVVKQSDGVWLDFELPILFDYTTLVILLSSVSMHWAFIAAKKNLIKQIRLALGVTFVLGSMFLAGQYMAWGELVDSGVYFVGNPAGSFLYVLTGVHGLHLISAVIFLIVVLISAFQYKIHSKSLVQLEICTTYWHFLGGLWLYLYLFLALNH
ncbi:cytochrome c oxidase subunit 3 [Reichenbachiella sp. MALMAid0571]|uniref:cytochrome c oxidase subunit 3 n=1 Tax=Reichenbachiella sp. MALMAid0571 TaxID=3143939 RepID=UPI0032DEB762